VLYRSSQPLATWSNYFTISTDEEYKHLRRAILDVSEGAGSQQILPELLGSVDIVSYRELVPRMKDIFIKLVSEK